ncbi:MAG: SDR family oxidoreductase [Caulobacteraceae bacterium]
MTDSLIVGASRGIGLGLARELLRRGHAVCATERSPSAGLDALAAESGGRLTRETVDIADGASSEALRDRLAGRRFDVVLINAGVGGPRERNPRNVAGDEFAKLMVTNALGPARLAELLAKSVKPDVGVVAFMTSQLGSVEQNTSGGFELYRASKAALNSLIRSFAARHADKKLAVLALHPGWVKTDMGGPQAPLGVDDSVRGLADILERAAADRKSGYLDYQGQTLPW